MDIVVSVLPRNSKGHYTPWFETEPASRHSRANANVIILYPLIPPRTFKIKSSSRGYCDMAQPLSTPLPLPISSGCLVGFAKSGYAQHYVVHNIFAGNNTGS